MGLFCSEVFLQERTELVMVWGGERKDSKGLFYVGCSIYAQFIGKPAYLEPISQSMQKPIGGLSALAVSATNSMLKNRDEPICRLLANQCRNQ